MFMICIFVWLPPSQQGHSKNGCAKSLHLPRQYEDVHTNQDSDCYVLQVTTLNFIFTPVVMGMTLTLVSISWLSFFSLFARVDGIYVHCYHFE